jgi:xylulokinase
VATENLAPLLWGRSILNLASVSEPVLIGLDFGTTNLKGVCFTTTGQSLVRAEVQTPRNHPKAGWTEWDPAQIWDTMIKLLQGLLQRLPSGYSPVGLSVASVAESVVGIDKRGHPVGPIIAWHDRRSVLEAEWLRSQISEEDVFAITGSPIDATFALFKLLWLQRQRPEQFNAAVHWLLVADWIAFSLTGEMAANASLASRTLAFEISTLEWSDKILQAAGLDRMRFAEVRPSGTPIGKVIPEIANRCGLPKDLVVAVGGHDHVCGAIAAGALRPGILLDSIGTSEALFAPIAAPTATTQFLRASFCQGVVQVVQQSPSYYAIGGMPSAGECVEWFMKLLPGDEDIASLSNAASGCDPNRTLFVPHLRYVSSPTPQRNARGAFFGLTIDTSMSELFRAVLEGIAFEGKFIIDNLISMSRAEPVAEIWCVGKAFQNNLFQQIKANVNGVPLRVAEQPDLAARGAAILAGLGAGTYRSIEEALQMSRGHWSKRFPEEALQQEYQQGQVRYNRVRENVRLLAQELYAH